MDSERANDDEIGRSRTSQAEDLVPSDSRHCLVTIPNLLCIARILGSPWLLMFAANENTTAVLVLFALLAATDWVDGKLAIWLNQRSPIGPHLDSAADVTLYTAMLVSGIWLEGDLLIQEWAWIASAVMSYGLSCFAAVWRFRRFPGYHTRTAKTAWWLVVGATIAILLDGPIWLLRIAICGVVSANLEAILITLILPTSHTDVRSMIEAWRVRHPYKHPTNP